jgi:hypothetical protein
MPDSGGKVDSDLAKPFFHRGNYFVAGRIGCFAQNPKPEPALEMKSGTTCQDLHELALIDPPLSNPWNSKGDSMLRWPKTDHHVYDETLPEAGICRQAVDLADQSFR